MRLSSGNMGYPDLRATLEGKRSGMDMYERAVVSAPVLLADARMSN